MNLLYLTEVLMDISDLLFVQNNFKESSDPLSDFNYSLIETLKKVFLKP